MRARLLVCLSSSSSNFLLHKNRNRLVAVCGSAEEAARKWCDDACVIAANPLIETRMRRVPFSLQSANLCSVAIPSSASGFAVFGCSGQHGTPRAFRQCTGTPLPPRLGGKI